MAEAHTFPQTIQSLEQLETLVSTWIETPIGRMLAIADESNVRMLEFVDRRALAREMSQFQERFKSVPEGTNEILELLRRELADYFSSISGKFTVPIVQHGTQFEEQVWTALRTIPLGETRSYGEIARQLGYPDAPRAVGRANGRNQISIIVPCHRVIGTDGSLVGYGGKLWRKKWLLDHERRMIGKQSDDSLASFLMT